MEVLSKRGLLKEIVIFSTIGVVVLISKILFNELFRLFCPLELSYFLVHILILFESYFLHSKKTFKQKMGISPFAKYSALAMIFKALDYGVYIVMLHHTNASVLVCIMVASAVATIFRYVSFKRFVFSKKGGVGK
jgi:putative flippase GtrA